MISSPCRQTSHKIWIDPKQNKKCDGIGARDHSPKHPTYEKELKNSLGLGMVADAFKTITLV